nr:ubiquitin-like domain-containing protein [Nakamurella aerolata]
MLVGVGGPTFGAGSKELTVTIDGARQPVTTTLDSVGDVLAHAGVVVGTHDTVSPALSAPVAPGTTITIERARLVSVTVNGEHRQVWSKADTVADAVRQLGIDPAGYQFSRDPAARLVGTKGVSLTAQQLHSAKVIDGAERPVAVRTVAGTVGELLAAQGIQLGDRDTVTPSADTPLSEGQRIVVTRTSVTEQTSTRPVPAPKATVVVDKNLGKGLTKNVKGKAGTRTIVTRLTTVNDKTSKKVIADKVTAAPVAPKRIVGAKETGDPVSWSVPWDKMAMCESSGRWDLGYGMAGAKGGLQFLTSTWLAFGGGEFAPSANRATKNQQIIVAERLYAQQGLAPWACARILGWGFDKYTGPLPGRH